MKKIAVITAIFFLIVGYVARGNTFNQEKKWQSIREITAFECAIIESASKKICVRVIENADYFILERNLVIVHFQNSDVGYYGVRGRKSAISETTKNSQLDQVEERNKIFYRFADIWNNKMSPNELTPDELNHADGFMFEYLNKLSRLQNGSPEIAGNVDSIASRGNRYVSKFENLFSPLNDYFLMASFYDYYIQTAENGDTRTRDQDKPSDEDKHAALTKLINAIQNLAQGEDFRLTVTTERFFKKNEPAMLQSLINKKLIKPNNYGMLPY